MPVNAVPGSDGSLFRFEQDLRVFADAIDARLEDAVRAVAVAVYRGVKERTPVDTGYARSNWQISFGQPADATRPVGEYDDVQVLARGPIDPSQVIWISNNVPYIRRLEYGWSRQAPNGMVRVTMADVQNRIEAIMREALAAKTGRAP